MCAVVWTVYLRLCLKTHSQKSCDYSISSSSSSYNGETIEFRMYAMHSLTPSRQTKRAYHHLLLAIVDVVVAFLIKTPNSTLNFNHFTVIRYVYDEIHFFSCLLFILHVDDIRPLSFCSLTLVFFTAQMQLNSTRNRFFSKNTNQNAKEIHKIYTKSTK